MTEKEQLLAAGESYLTIGDLDKDFHLPECECYVCEQWRLAKGRPTHGEVRKHLEGQRDKN